MYWCSYAAVQLHSTCTQLARDVCSYTRYTSTVARPYLRPIWDYFLTTSILSAFLVQTKYESAAAIYNYIIRTLAALVSSNMFQIRTAVRTWGYGRVTEPRRV